jgi:hypothetical protein
LKVRFYVYPVFLIPLSVVGWLAVHRVVISQSPLARDSRRGKGRATPPKAPQEIEVVLWQHVTKCLQDGLEIQTRCANRNRMTNRRSKMCRGSVHSTRCRCTCANVSDERKIMNHNPEISSFLHDWFGDSTDIGRAERIEKSKLAIDDFFQQCDLQKSRHEDSARVTKSEQAEFVGLDDYSVNETEASDLDRLRGIGSPKLSELSELRDFCKSEISEVRKSGITRAGIRSSLAALRSILGRVVERL